MEQYDTGTGSINGSHTLITISVLTVATKTAQKHSIWQWLQYKDHKIQSYEDKLNKGQAIFNSTVSGIHRPIGQSLRKLFAGHSRTP